MPETRFSEVPEVDVVVVEGMYVVDGETGNKEDQGHVVDAPVTHKKAQT